MDIMIVSESDNLNFDGLYHFVCTCLKHKWVILTFIFTKSAPRPLGGFSRVVTVSVCMYVCILYLCPFAQANLFLWDLIARYLSDITASYLSDTTKPPHFFLFFSFFCDIICTYQQIPCFPYAACFLLNLGR